MGERERERGRERRERAEGASAQGCIASLVVLPHLPEFRSFWRVEVRLALSLELSSSSSDDWAEAAPGDVYRLATVREGNVGRNVDRSRPVLVFESEQFDSSTPPHTHTHAHAHAHPSHPSGPHLGSSST